MVMGREYHRKYSQAYYHQKRQEYAALLGGKCARCPSIEGLQFDHIDWRAKSFAMGKLLSVSKDVALAELKKCQLLCHPCHVVKNRSDRAERKLERSGGEAANRT
jgi:5-methylcytosine-specific restriction endonuclease McrA